MTATTTSLGRRDQATPMSPTAAEYLPVFVPRCDIYEREDGLVLLLELPGVAEGTLAVELEGRQLTISGRCPEEERQGLKLVQREFRPGNYRRTFTLSEEIDGGKIDASLRNGVLRLHLPKVEAAKPKRITVKVS